MNAKSEKKKEAQGEIWSPLLISFCLALLILRFELKQRRISRILRIKLQFADKRVFHADLTRRLKERTLQQTLYTKITKWEPRLWYWTACSDQTSYPETWDSQCLGQTSLPLIYLHSADHIQMISSSQSRGAVITFKPTSWCNSMHFSNHKSYNFFFKVFFWCVFF